MPVLKRLMPERVNMPEKFQEGQRIVIEQLIALEGELPVPPGWYVIVEVSQSLLGKPRCRIRSLPDENLEVELDLHSLSASARAMDSPEPAE
jgi:hypothetical protein